MGKHLRIKGFILLVVILFHSFVLVPKANATTFEGIIGRIGFRALAPSVIAGMSGGMGIVAGVIVGGGLGIILLKSGAITALKNWLNVQLGNSPPAESSIAIGGYVGFYIYSGGELQCRAQKVSSTNWAWQALIAGNWTSLNYGPPYTSITACANAAQAAYGQYGHVPHSFSPGAAPPTVPTDYATALASSQPDLATTGQVYATPGAAAALTGGAAISSIAQASDADITAMIAGLGATEVNGDTGAQAGSPGATTDNTVTAGDTASIGLLQTIMNYVSNLIGIKATVDATRTTLDNSLVVQQSQAAKLDNIAVLTAQQKMVMDNVGVAIHNQTAILDNVGANIAHMDNTLSGINTTTATSSTVQTRIDALKTAASSKFPFSLVSSLTASVPSGTSHYEFGSLPLTPSISIPIEPMSGPLATLFGWIRQLLVWFFWAGTLLAMLRRTMEM